MVNGFRFQLRASLQNKDDNSPAQLIDFTAIPITVVSVNLEQAKHDARVALGSAGPDKKWVFKIISITDVKDTNHGG